MRAVSHPAQVGGLSAGGEARPTRRELERHVLATVAGVSRSMAARAADAAVHAGGDVYAKAVATGRQQVRTREQVQELRRRESEFDRYDRQMRKRPLEEERGGGLQLTGEDLEQFRMARSSLSRSKQ